MSYGYLSRTPRDIKRQLGNRLSVEEEINACDIRDGDVIWIRDTHWAANLPFSPYKSPSQMPQPPPSILGIVRDIETISRCISDSGLNTKQSLVSCRLAVVMNLIDRFGLLPSEKEIRVLLSYERSERSYLRDEAARIVRLYRGGSIPYEDVFV